MKFIVSRTSTGRKPCKEAKKAEKSDGFDYPNIWTIEIDTLEELINFVKKYGTIIIDDSGEKSVPFEIEIYDDYRE